MTPTVRLREVEPADLVTFYEMQADPVATTMAAFPARDRETHTIHWRRILASPAVLARTILADEEVAGNIVSFDFDGERDVGYWIGRAFWGRGIATAALAAFLEVDDGPVLVARVANHNVGSRRVLEKCGFSVVRTDTPGPDGIAEVILRLER